MPIVIIILILIYAVVGAKFWYIAIPIAWFIGLVPSLSKQSDRTRFDTYKMRLSLPSLIIGVALGLPSGILFSSLESGRIGYIYLLLFLIGSFLLLISGTMKQTPEDVEEARLKKEADERKKEANERKLNLELEAEVEKSPFGKDKIKHLYSREHLIRYMRAINHELVVVKVDRKTRTAVFRSRHDSDKTYKTSLSRCNCPDYLGRDVSACKHMFFLADELNLLSDYNQNLPQNFDSVMTKYENTQYSSDYDSWLEEHT
ncbi:hypothetical protein FACS18949_11770 [Clostridia bacterium]|nr:hypothetical protein FACS18949_11770 [Clostridia bacterium]